MARKSEDACDEVNRVGWPLFSGYFHWKALRAIKESGTNAP